MTAFKNRYADIVGYPPQQNGIVFEGFFRLTLILQFFGNKLFLHHVIYNIFIKAVTCVAEQIESTECLADRHAADVTVVDTGTYINDCFAAG